MATLYYRFKGTPEDRPGGPWWHKEFVDQGELNTYLHDIKPFLADQVIEDDHCCVNRLSFPCPHQYPLTRVKRKA